MFLTKKQRGACNLNALFDTQMNTTKNDIAVLRIGPV